MEVRHLRSGWAIIGASGAKRSEIAAALGIRRNILWRNCGRIFLPSPFLRPEEERFLFVGIVVVRDKYRTSNCVAKIMLLVSRIRVRRIIAGFPGPRVEHIVA